MLDLRRRAEGATVILAAVDGRAHTVRVSEGRRGYALVDGAPEALDVVRHMLRLDEDLSRFYAMVADDDQLAWAKRGAGRMLRSPTVFEDVVKTVCTTNCAWSGTDGSWRLG